MADPTKAATATISAPAAELAFQIIPITEEVPYLKMLVYGAYGSGKTTLCATAADVDAMADVLMLDIESGKMTVAESDRIKRKDRIDAIRISSFKQLAKVHEFLKAHCRYRDDKSASATENLKKLEAKFRGVDVKEIKEPRRYKAVMIDSTSELDQLTMYELLGISTDMKLDDALSDNDMEVADWPIFRKNNQMMQLIIRAYRDLPIHAFFICHAAYTQDEMKRFHYSPSMTGKLKDQIQGFVDIVGYLTVGNVPDGQKEAPRRLYVQPVGKFDAKNRKASFKESYFDNPTMSNVWKGIHK